MADPVTIYNDEILAGQNPYTLPSNLAFRPTAVSALFNGSGAGSPFLAALSFYTSSGQLLARQFPETPLEAGEAARATFAPFLDRGAGAAPSAAALEYVRHTPYAYIPTGTDPSTCTGEFYVAMPADPIPGDDPLSLGAGAGEIYLSADPGIAGPDYWGVYNIGPIAFPTSNFGFQTGTIGVGVTEPGGVPYMALLVGGYQFGEAAILVPNVTDPDAATYFNRARPLWPATYGAGDTLFSGFWVFPIRVD